MQKFQERKRTIMPESQYMKRAIELARKGEGWVNPNPMVGAVIVKDGKIIGEGYHARCGELHAERNAIASLTESAQGAVLYVTLEPCCHYGRTPPCTQAILEQKISTVIIGSRDPNPKVAGKGVKLLRDAGVTVVEDFMREECDKLNPVFFHYITTRTPYVVMKYAMTADGKIATKTGASRWITGEEARNFVHQMRHGYMGIMAGIGTVLADDPMLNVRLQGRKSPVRIICDSALRIPLNSRICRTAKEYRTIVACAVERGDVGEQTAQKIAFLEHLGIQVVSLPDSDKKVDLKKLTEYLGGQGIDSVLLEGGAELNDSALRAGIVKEVKVFIAPKLFGGAGAKSPVTGIGVETPGQSACLKLEKISPIGEDLLLEYRIKDSPSAGGGHREEDICLLES
jgi:diaminohydroxyphosphoribosylaminopyrimidine deaminase/5-amino-6-(5-phosphoribosylamino)uracil reductase